MFAAGGRGERVNHGLAIGRPVEPDRIQHIALGRETKVFGCIARRVGIVKRSRRYFGWTFAIDPPRSSTVNRIPIRIQPRADIEKHLLHFFGDGAIRSWTDVQQQIAILADDINELMDHELRRLERVVFDIAPWFVTYRSVGLPVERTDIA